MTKQTLTGSADAKSASITLHANGSTLVLLAVRRSDGTALTTVTTKGPDKKAVRGMTESHADLTAARAHLTGLAKQAEKLGWQRRAWGASNRPADAFAKLPVAPKKDATA